MKEPIIDEYVKSYLVACLVSGIHVVAEPEDFMNGLVDHMNGLTERLFWATGDQDGIIIHDKHDNPVLSLLYTGQTLKFMMFEQDEYLSLGITRDAGFMLLNILAYIRDKGLQCEPECVRTETTVIPPQPSNDQDWSL